MAVRNQTVELTADEERRFLLQCAPLERPYSFHESEQRIVCQSILDALPFIPDRSVDLIVADPPYNLDKRFNAKLFRSRPMEAYRDYIDSWLQPMMRVLNPDGSLYICSDWRGSGAVQDAMSRYVTIQNRITWEREKGRGATRNWKNASEDIWFGTVDARKYSFNVEAVKLRKKVVAPYREKGQPKDWSDEREGRFRLTHPSNLWTDLTVPFWSMPENTAHPTQKPEKLIAKLVLASCPEGGVVLDPFAGSGTTAVVCRKLERSCLAVEIDPHYCALGVKRLTMALQNPRIQGYANEVFYERNSKPERKSPQSDSPVQDHSSN